MKLFIALILVTASAQADDFQLLKLAFDGAVPAQVSDFPKIDDLNVGGTHKCFAAEVTTLKAIPLRSVRIGRYDRLIPGLPNRGPLFPGSPDRIEAKLTMVIDQEEAAEFSTADLLKYFEKYEFEETVVSSSPGIVLEFYSDWMNTNQVLTYRKNGTLVYFHQSTHNRQTAIDSEIYGYCYPHLKK